MEIQKFKPEIIKNYKMFYMLQALNSDSENINLYLQEVNGQSVYVDYSLFEMNNKKLLVAFPNQFKYSHLYNLVATDGIKSEIVSMQPFERIWKWYKSTPSDNNNGVFSFLNSLPAMDELRNWRCDYGMYGPEIFTDPFGVPYLNIPVNLEDLVVYEQILSVNGVGYLTFTIRTDDEDREGLYNNSYTPFASPSISGTLKLITEWAFVAQDPFNNEENIADRARSFCNKLNINEDLVSNQEDMQIFKYLNGQTDSRTLPSQSFISNDLEIFVKKSIAYSTLSACVAVNPDSWNINEILAEEQDIVNHELREYLAHEIFDDIQKNIENADEILNFIEQNFSYEQYKAFSRLKIGFLKTKQELINRLQNNQDEWF